MPLNKFKKLIGKNSQLPTDADDFLVAMRAEFDAVGTAEELKAKFEEIRSHIAQNIKGENGDLNKSPIYVAFYKTYASRIESLLVTASEVEQTVLKKELGRILVKAAQAKYMTATSVRGKITSLKLGESDYSERALSNVEASEERAKEKSIIGELGAAKRAQVNTSGTFGMKERHHWEKRADEIIENSRLSNAEKVSKLEALLHAINKAQYDTRGSDLIPTLAYINEAIVAKGGEAQTVQTVQKKAEVQKPKQPNVIMPPTPPKPAEVKKPEPEHVPLSLKEIPGIDDLWPKIIRTIQKRESTEDLMNFFNKWRTAAQEKWGIAKDMLELFFNYIIHHMEIRAEQLGETFNASNPFAGASVQKNQTEKDHSELGHMKRLFASCNEQEKTVIRELMKNKIGTLEKEGAYLVIAQAIKAIDPNLAEVSNLVMAIHASKTPFMELLRCIVENKIDLHV